MVSVVGAAAVLLLQCMSLTLSSTFTAPAEIMADAVSKRQSTRYKLVEDTKLIEKEIGKAITYQLLQRRACQRVC
jgi:hypothetical protein